MEAKISRSQRRFLESLKIEVDSALGELGSVEVVEKSLGRIGSPYLCVICDHVNVASVDTHVQDLVRAIWRASQSISWQSLEWKPLVIAWPRIALINTVRGKALSPALIELSSETLFGTEKDFEVQFHHRIPIPIEEHRLIEAGLSVHENPMVRAVVQLQENVMAFSITLYPLISFSDLLIEREIPEEVMKRVLTKYNVELDRAQRVAQESYRKCVNILSASASPKTEEWIERLNRLCNILIFCTSEGSQTQLTLETLSDWAESFEKSTENLVTVVQEILESSV